MSRRPKASQERRDAPVFEVCVHGQPVSAQTRRRPALQAWKNRIRNACEAAWERAPIDGNVIICVTHYYETAIGDVDNLIKPIQDALQGVVYVNDKQVRDVTGKRRPIAGRFKVRYISMPLAAAFSNGRQFVHIQVWHSPKREELG
ncbi:MAG: RusA family crossover junction endodeoxyribonuclease [Acetobacteraceae bacterium]|nr:RusA family crossover junction endodeoxyribonuclease [Acetobacteraceae bacterium]